MAHFAKLNEDNIVTQVIVVSNNDILVDGVESEQKGIEFCQSLLDGKWVQTSYNNNFRKRYAGIGYIYDPVRDVFLRPKPAEACILDGETLEWSEPIPKPNDGKYYTWNQEKGIWDDGLR